MFTLYQPEMSYDNSGKFKINFNLPEISFDISGKFKVNLNLPELSFDISGKFKVNLNLLANSKRHFHEISPIFR